METVVWDHEKGVLSVGEVRGQVSRVVLSSPKGKRQMKRGFLDTDRHGGM